MPDVLISVRIVGAKNADSKNEEREGEKTPVVKNDERIERKKRLKEKMEKFRKKDAKGGVLKHRI